MSQVHQFVHIQSRALLQNSIPFSRIFPTVLKSSAPYATNTNIQSNNYLLQFSLNITSPLNQTSNYHKYFTTIHLHLHP